MQLALFEASFEELPSPILDSAGEGRDSPALSPAPNPAPITLSDVIAAVYASHPALDAVSRERQIAAGKQLAAMGQFDITLAAESINQPLSFYENYRHSFGFKQYTWDGAQTFAGYRIGRGEFEPWYKERETNEGGEFKVAYAKPFLRDLHIDKRRAAAFQAQIARAAAEPLIQMEVITTIRSASVAYWHWLAAGQRVRIAEQMLQLATDRQAGLGKRAERGEIAGIELVDNQRLIVARQAKLIDEQLKLNQAALRLSLFFRDPNGNPLIAGVEEIPTHFPDAVLPQVGHPAELLTAAIQRRPELRLLDYQREQKMLEVEQASNLALPALNGIVSVSQDVGEPASSLRDKSQLELEAGLVLEMQLQRREASGRLQAARGELAQLSASRRLAEQNIIVEVQTALAALEAQHAAIMQSRHNLELAKQLANAERIKLEQGDSNILLLNLREVAISEAETAVVETLTNYFIAQTSFHAAVAGELAEPRWRESRNGSEELPLSVAHPADESPT